MSPIVHPAPSTVALNIQLVIPVINKFPSFATFSSAAIPTIGVSTFPA